VRHDSPLHLLPPRSGRCVSLERDGFRLNRHRALDLRRSVIFFRKTGIHFSGSRSRFDITRLPSEAKLVALALNPPMRRDALARDQTHLALQSRPICVSTSGKNIFRQNIERTAASICRDPQKRSQNVQSAWWRCRLTSGDTSGGTSGDTKLLAEAAAWRRPSRSAGRCR